MPDRVREAIFDVLGSWCGTLGRIPPVQVLDLFAGSGAMGLEAVSRGAAGCLFVERAQGAVRVLQSNLDNLQADLSLRVVAADVWTCPIERMRPGRQAAGLVFVDPPYRDARNTAPNGKVARLLDRIMRADLLSDDVVAVLHHERAVGYTPVAGRSWTLADRREYGQTAISFVTRPTPEDPAPEEQASHGEETPLET
jgi:16S rRNA (guanine966-N2)-methyltransferase